MALKFISIGNFPTYLAVSGDIADNKIDGATIEGGTVYLTDTGAWKIITEDAVLVDFMLPSSYTPS